MTDKEIIKALECCNEPPSQCDDCPLSGMVGCQAKTMESALDLINRQQAEIERLTINMNAFGLGMKREKERADIIKSEAIKEFWEKLWELDPEIISKVVSFDLDELNNLIKETVGDIE